MIALERGIVWLSLQLASVQQINDFFGDAQVTAVILGALIALSGGILGSFLMLRGMTLTSDAISHTVLLGIVLAFIIIAAAGAQPELSSPWLLIGAAAAGVGTVVLTELLHSSGLVKQDAALGLVFPLLFAIAVIFVARYVDDVHLDEDSVMVGEIGVAWANTNSHSFSEYDTIVITEDDPRAEFVRKCLNCREEGISPRDPGAQFTEECSNCGEYTHAEAYDAGLVDDKPVLVFWPASLTVMLVLFIITLIFVTLFYKELKLSTFDPGLAKSLGFSPGVMLYALMTLVSLVAVGAFEAVGSILVIAFFIIPPAAAYLLTDRLSTMLLLSSFIGMLSSWQGYELAKGNLFGLDLNRLFQGGWNSSISASMVVMMLMLFIITFLVSPKYGLVSGSIRRRKQKQEFEEQVVLGHVYHHSGTPEEALELKAESLNIHVQWPDKKTRKVLSRLLGKSLVIIDENRMLHLSTGGRKSVEKFWRGNLARQSVNR